ncbi:uncharacterized protein LY79DRAFT_537234 [Colletotrichum navitas]|uniref:Secreted protein n=1 Tax=Colletotrichum navitas TaxID=681940 RepID=A0AAD8QD79_9PEZI|nr:uncharacterized protein LY79DRAFT_537234 [Colletotrichum navitas]KAK1599173.1 hypothetical protein LY79DRAFT_537234 [Colletotrichum navitas]
MYVVRFCLSLSVSLSLSLSVCVCVCIDAIDQDEDTSLEIRGKYEHVERGSNDTNLEQERSGTDLSVFLLFIYTRPAGQARPAQP